MLNSYTVLIFPVDACCDKPRLIFTPPPTPPCMLIVAWRPVNIFIKIYGFFFFLLLWGVFFSWGGSLKKFVFTLGLSLVLAILGFH